MEFRKQIRIDSKVSVLVQEKTFIMNGIIFQKFQTAQKPPYFEKHIIKFFYIYFKKVYYNRMSDENISIINGNIYIFIWNIVGFFVY